MFLEKAKRTTRWQRIWRNPKGTNAYTRRTDHRFVLDDLDLSEQIFPDLYDLAQVAAWEPYNLHGPGHGSSVGSENVQILHSI